jgi:hypothetical protein
MVLSNRPPAEIADAVGAVFSAIEFVARWLERDTVLPVGYQRIGRSHVFAMFAPISPFQTPI